MDASVAGHVTSLTVKLRIFTMKKLDSGSLQKNFTDPSLDYKLREGRGYVLFIRAHCKCLISINSMNG